MAFRHPVNIIYLWINQAAKAGMIFTLLQSELFASKMHLFYREKGPIGDVHKGLRDGTMFIGRKIATPGQVSPPLMRLNVKLHAASRHSYARPPYFPYPGGMRPNRSGCHDYSGADCVRPVKP